MPDASPEKAADPPLAPLSVSLVLATLFIGGVTFVCGTVTFTVIGSVLFGISLDDRQLLACGSMAAAVMAVVTAWRWCRNARRRAALSASDTVGNRRVFQFTLRSFLLFQFYVALALGLIRWLGFPVVPCVGGIAGAAVGYWLTLFLARRRVYDVVVSCLFGILASLILYAITLPRRLTPDSSNAVRNWTVLVLLLIPPLAAAVAKWKLRRRGQQD